jgi:hypothetical protein
MCDNRKIFVVGCTYEWLTSAITSSLATHHTTPPSPALGNFGDGSVGFFHRDFRAQFSRQRFILHLL